MIDILDLVDVPSLDIRGGIVVGRLFGIPKADVQDKAGRIHFAIPFDDIRHADPIKRKHAARPNKTRPTGEESAPVLGGHLDE